MLLNLAVLPFPLNILTLIQLLVNASHVFKATMLKVEFAKGSFALKDKFPPNMVSSAPTSLPSAELTIFKGLAGCQERQRLGYGEFVNPPRKLQNFRFD